MLIFSLRISHAWAKGLLEGMILGANLLGLPVQSDLITINNSRGRRKCHNSQHHTKWEGYVLFYAINLLAIKVQFISQTVYSNLKDWFYFTKQSDLLSIFFEINKHFWDKLFTSNLIPNPELTDWRKSFSSSNSVPNFFVNLNLKKSWNEKWTNKK